jgi:hypothetical protein
MNHKIELALDKYDSTANVDAWEVGFIIGESLTTKRLMI